MEKSKVFLNTWGAYNNGSIGYGWMNPEDAREFIEEDDERDGGEWFIADIDNYTGVDFGPLDYADVFKILDALETLNDMDDHEREEVAAVLEYLGSNDVDEAIDKRDDYIIFSDLDQYHDHCDELLEFNGNETLERYFDWDAYHRDCDFDVYEASNGICILN